MKVFALLFLLCGCARPVVVVASGGAGLSPSLGTLIETHCADCHAVDDEIPQLSEDIALGAHLAVLAAQAVAGRKMPPWPTTVSRLEREQLVTRLCQHGAGDVRLCIRHTLGAGLAQRVHSPISLAWQSPALEWPEFFLIKGIIEDNPKRYGSPAPSRSHECLVVYTHGGCAMCGRTVFERSFGPKRTALVELRGGAMILSRRDFLRSSSAVPFLAPSVSSAGNKAVPRALIFLFSRGGLDAGLSTDPKTRGGVLNGLDHLPPEAIQRFGELEVGPLLAPWGHWLERCAIMNGIRCGTVAHKTGTAHVLRMKRYYEPRAPILPEIVGHHLNPDAPWPAVIFGNKTLIRRGQLHGNSLVAHLTRTKDASFPYTSSLELLSQLARSGRKEKLVKLLGQSTSAGFVRTQMAMQRMAGLTMAAPPKISAGRVSYPKVWSAQRIEKHLTRLSVMVRDSIFLLKNRLTGAIFICDNLADRDSHQANLVHQFGTTETQTPALLSLLNALAQTRMPEGNRLLDEVGIVVFSELGRFPIVNADRGKDHLPELPVMMMGPGIRHGKFGVTDKRMLSVPIDFSSGQARGIGTQNSHVGGHGSHNPSLVRNGGCEILRILWPVFGLPLLVAGLQSTTLVVPSQ